MQWGGTSAEHVWRCRAVQVAQGSMLSSALLRQVLAPAALAGLGSTAGRSLQQEFDGCVACLSAMTSGCKGAAQVLQQALQLAQGAAGADGDVAKDALGQIVRLLSQQSFGQMFSEGAGGGGEEVVGEGSGESGGGAGASRVSGSGSSSGPMVDVVDLLQGGAAAVEGRLAGWEGLVRSHQAPSRVLRWAME